MMSPASSSAPSSRRTFVSSMQACTIFGSGSMNQPRWPEHIAVTGTLSRIASRAASIIGKWESSIPSKPYERAFSCFSFRDAPGTRRDWTASFVIDSSGDALCWRRSPDRRGIRGSRSPHGVRRLVEDSLAEHSDRLRETLAGRGEAVFVLDAQHMVVTGHAERAHEALPEERVVPVAHGPEDPAAGGDVAVRGAVEHAVSGRVPRIDRGVLRVDVDDRLAQLTDREDRVDRLPEEGAGIEVRADHRALRIAEAQERARVIDDEPRVHLEAQLHAVIGRHRPGLAPVRDHRLVPLPADDVAELGRPGARHPVRLARVGAVARATAEQVDDADPELLGELERLYVRVVGSLRERTVRV